MLLLATALFINYIDRGLLPIAAPSMQAQLHLSASQLGILASAFFWTYAIVQVPIGWIAERFGAERVLAAGLGLWALSTICVGVSSGFVTLVILRLLLGLGESTGFPCMSKLIAGAVPPAQIGEANGIVGFAYLIGPAVGTFLGGMLMARFGWRAGFLCFGALSLLWLWPWLRLIAKRPPTTVAATLTPTLKTLLSQRALWGAGLGHFSSNYTYYFMLSWLPYYLVKERGFSDTEMAKLAGLAYLVTAIAAFLGGWSIDRYIAAGGSPTVAHKSVLGAAHAGAVLCMLGMAAGDRPIALSCIFVYMALVGASSPGVFAVSQILAGPKATGRWVGIQNAMGNMAGVAAPALTGFIIDLTGHFTAAFVLCAVMSLLGVLGWVFMMPRLAEIDWERA